MNTYTPDPRKIVHNTSVDFQKRLVSNPIHIVQYDTGMPIVAVSLYSNNAIYELPPNVKANIRLKKKDGKVVYNPVLGCNEDRNVLYFEVTYQMTVVPGLIRPVLELVFDETANIAASSAIDIEIDKNPIQQDVIDSFSETKTIVDYALHAKQSAVAAKESEEKALASEQAAKTSETNAKASETAAKTSETNAKTSETNAKASETNALTSETNAKASETAAKESEDKAKASETAAKTSEDNAADSATAAATSEANAKDYADAAKASEDNAKASEDKAANSATAAATSEANAKTSEDNALASKSAAATSADSAATSASTATEAADIATDAANNALANAVRAEETDIGQLVKKLAQHELPLCLTDSDNDAITDSDGDPVKGATYFVDTANVVDIVTQIANTVFEARVSEMEAQVAKLSSSAILDSNS